MGVYCTTANFSVQENFGGFSACEYYQNTVRDMRFHQDIQSKTTSANQKFAKFPARE